MLTKKDRQQFKEELLVEFSSVFATREDLITFKDAILGEIRSMREEFAVVTGYRGMIADLEDRMDVVEAKV